MDKINVDIIIEKVLDQLKIKNGRIRVEVSGRHVHLSNEDAIKLFGTDDLTPVKELSQPGQFVCKEKVRIIGIKGDFKDVAVLGPCRSKTQVEISMTDARILGIPGVVRDSGDTDGAPSVWIQSNRGMIEAISSTIVASPHIHMTPYDASRYSLEDGEKVNVRVNGTRPIIFEEVLVRVNPNYALNIHIDYDEANAIGSTTELYGEIL